MVCKPYVPPKIYLGISKSLVCHFRIIQNSSTIYDQTLYSRFLYFKRVQRQLVDMMFRLFHNQPILQSTRFLPQLTRQAFYPTGSAWGVPISSNLGAFLDFASFKVFFCKAVFPLGLAAYSLLNHTNPECTYLVNLLCIYLRPSKGTSV